ncbi:MAG: hypothetical protein QOG30_623, partial [Acidimicrobiaceae bacterium]
AFAPSAEAASTATPITDYLNYPAMSPSLLPADCTVSGPAVLSGIQYVVRHNGVDSPASSDLASFTLVSGDKVTMTWADDIDGCEGIGISLSVKSAEQPTFDPNTDQHLVTFAYCSGHDCGQATPFGHLSVTVPDQIAACNFQLDAAIGPPLADVGPAGSYYSNVTRGENGKPHGTADDLNMLIGSNNGGAGDCSAPPAATATLACASVNGFGVDVAIHNPDQDTAAVVDVYKNGVVVSGSVNVPPLGDVTINIPFADNETAVVSVNDTVGGTVTPGTEIYSASFTADCHPGVSIISSCADHGTVVSFTNTGQAPVVFTVTKGGAVIDTVTVAATGTAQRIYPMSEGETATYRVTGPGLDTGDQTITDTCVLAQPGARPSAPIVQGTEVTRGATLPRTGSSSTATLSALAGLLFMLGGVLLALVNRPTPS